MRYLLLVIYAGGVGCLIAADLPAWAVAVIGIALIWHGDRQWHLHACLDRPVSVVGVEYHADDEWRILTRDGAIRPVQLGSSSFAHPWLSVLVFRGTPGAARTVALLPDMSDAGSLRRLRTLLRSGVLAH